MSAWVTYDWLYLCSNPQRLALTLRELPQEPFVGLDTMRLCWASHLDPDYRGGELAVYAERYAPAWLRCRTFDLSQLQAKLPSRLSTYWDNPKKRWALGMKLLMPYVAEGKPYLYTDDDVLVTSDPQPWMTNSFGSKGCFRFEGRKQSIAAQLFDAFELPYGTGWPPMVGCQLAEPAWKKYDRAALDAGVWFQKYNDDWTERLYSFAEMPYLLDLTTRNLELRCLDQRFLTAFGIKHGWDVRTIGNGFAPPAIATERMLHRHPFFHYKSQSKDRWMAVIDRYQVKRRGDI